MRGDDNQMKYKSRIMHLIKVFAVKCRPVPLIQTLDWALINTWLTPGHSVDTWSTSKWSWSTVGQEWLFFQTGHRVSTDIYTSQLTIGPLLIITDCRSSVDQYVDPILDQVLMGGGSVKGINRHSTTDAVKLMHLSMSRPRGGGDRAWGGDFDIF